MFQLFESLVAAESLKQNGQTQIGGLYTAPILTISNRVQELSPASEWLPTTSETPPPTRSLSLVPTMAHNSGV